MEGDHFVGKSVKIYSDVDDDWIEGVIEDYHPERGYRIQFFNGDDQWLSTLDGVQVEDDDINEHAEPYNPSPTMEHDEDFVHGHHSVHSDEEEEIRIQQKAVHYSRDEPSRSQMFGNAATDEVAIISEDELMNAQRDDMDVDLDDIEFDDPPEHGIIVVGKITEATDIGFDGGHGGKLYFKILLSAETAKSSMFRCKTPMFSSPQVPYDSNPLFRDSFFRFESSLPYTISAADSKAGAKPNGLMGELIIALLFVTSSGVHQVLGELAVDLGDLNTNGTVVFQRSDLEIRAVDGPMTINIRGRKVSAGVPPPEVHFAMRVAWKTSDFVASEPSAPSIGGRSKSTSGSVSSRQSSRAAPAKATTAGRGKLSATNNPGKTSGGLAANLGTSKTEALQATARPSSPASNRSSSHNLRAMAGETTVLHRPASAGGPMTIKRSKGGLGLEPPLKIAPSRLERKMYYQQKAIDEENARMVKRMQQRGRLPDANMYSKKAVPPSAKVRSKSRSKSRSRSRSKSRDRSDAKDAEAKSVKVTGNSILERRVTSAQDKELLEMITTLKRVNGDLAMENSSLKAKITKSKLHVQKYESSLSKMTKRGVPAAVLGPTTGLDTNAAPKSKLSLQADSKDAARARSGDDEKLARSVDSDYKAMENSLEDTELKEIEIIDSLQGQDEMAPISNMVDVLSVSRTGVDFVGVKEGDIYADPELGELAGEYLALQQIRMDLLDRISFARKTMQSAIDRVKCAEENAALVMMRLSSHFAIKSSSPAAPAADMTADAKGPQSKLLTNGRGKKDEIQKAQAKKRHESKGETQPTTNSNIVTSDIDDEVFLMEQIRQIETELKGNAALRKEELDMGPLRSSLDELGRILNSLHARIDVSSHEYENAKFEKDLSIDKLKHLIDERVAYSLRESISMMRSRLLRLKRKERMKPLELAVDAIEIELLRRELRNTQELEKIETKQFVRSDSNQSIVV